MPQIVAIEGLQKAEAFADEVCKRQRLLLIRLATFCLKLMQGGLAGEQGAWGVRSVL
jgi:hypothetical protein